MCPLNMLSKLWTSFPHPYDPKFEKLSTKKVRLKKVNNFFPEMFFGNKIRSAAMPQPARQCTYMQVGAAPVKKPPYYVSKILHFALQVRLCLVIPVPPPCLELNRQPPHLPSLEQPNPLLRVLTYGHTRTHARHLFDEMSCVPTCAS